MKPAIIQCSAALVSEFSFMEREANTCLRPDDWLMSSKVSMIPDTLNQKISAQGLDTLTSGKKKPDQKGKKLFPTFSLYFSQPFQ